MVSLYSMIYISFYGFTIFASVMSITMEEWVDEGKKCLSKWMNEWMNEWVNEGMNEWETEWINEWMNEWINEWMNEWNEWMNEWNEWMNDEYHDLWKRWILKWF